MVTENLVSSSSLLPEPRLLDKLYGPIFLMIRDLLSLSRYNATNSPAFAISSAPRAFLQEIFEESSIRQIGIGKVCVCQVSVRDMTGLYDRIVSIETLEAVGHEYFDDYFKTLDRLLKPGGRAVIQVITIPDERYENYRLSCDFIQKHIFPGGHLPSLGALKESIARASAFQVLQTEDIGPHYAETLRRWRLRFNARRAEILKLGYPERLFRAWNYYFSYCEAAFDARYIHDLHIVLARAGAAESLSDEKNPQSAAVR